MLLGIVGSASRCWSPMRMVTWRRGRRVWMIFFRLTPERSWRSRAIARAANTMVRWASIASRVWWKIGRAARSVLDIWIAPGVVESS